MELLFRVERRGVCVCVSCCALIASKRGHGQKRESSRYCAPPHFAPCGVFKEMQGKRILGGLVNSVS